MPPPATTHPTGKLERGNGGLEKRSLDGTGEEKKRRMEETTIDGILHERQRIREALLSLAAVEMESIPEETSPKKRRDGHALSVNSEATTLVEEKRAKLGSAGEAVHKKEGREEDNSFTYSGTGDDVIDTAAAAAWDDVHIQTPPALIRHLRAAKNMPRQIRRQDTASDTVATQSNEPAIPPSSPPPYLPSSRSSESGWLPSPVLILPRHIRTQDMTKSKEDDTTSDTVATQSNEPANSPPPPPPYFPPSPSSESGSSPAVTSGVPTKALKVLGIYRSFSAAVAQVDKATEAGSPTGTPVDSRIKQTEEDGTNGSRVVELAGGDQERAAAVRRLFPSPPPPYLPPSPSSESGSSPAVTSGVPTKARKVLGIHRQHSITAAGGHVNTGTEGSPTGTPVDTGIEQTEEDGTNGSRMVELAGGDPERATLLRRWAGGDPERAAVLRRWFGTKEESEGTMLMGRETNDEKNDDGPPSPPSLNLPPSPSSESGSPPTISGIPKKAQKVLGIPRQPSITAAVAQVNTGTEAGAPTGIPVDTGIEQTEKDGTNGSRMVELAGGESERAAALQRLSRTEGKEGTMLMGRETKDEKKGDGNAVNGSRWPQSTDDQDAETPYERAANLINVPVSGPLPILRSKAHKGLRFLASIGNPAQESATEEQIFRNEVAAFSALREWTAQDPTIVDKLHQLVSAGGGDSPDTKVGVIQIPRGRFEEIDKLVKMANNLQEAGLSWAKDAETQRRELALEPGSFKIAYFDALRGGICNSYYAASVIASDMVTTSKTGAMGMAGKFLGMVAGVVPVIPGLKTLAAGLKEGDRFLQTRSIVKMTDMAADINECCILAKRVALRLTDAATDDARQEKSSGEDAYTAVTVTNEHEPDLPSLSEVGEDGEDAMEWFVEEVLSSHLASLGESKTVSTRAGRRMAKVHLKMLLKAVTQGCLRETRDPDKKVEILVKAIFPGTQQKLTSASQDTGESTERANPSPHSSPSKASSAASLPIRGGLLVENESDVIKLSEQVVASEADLEAPKATAAELQMRGADVETRSIAASVDLAKRSTKLGDTLKSLEVTSAELAAQNTELEESVAYSRATIAELVKRNTELLEWNTDLGDSLESLKGTSDELFTRHTEIEGKLETVVEVSRETTAADLATKNSKAKPGLSSNDAVTGPDARDTELETKLNSEWATRDAPVAQKLNVEPGPGASGATTGQLVHGASRETTLIISTSTGTEVVERSIEPENSSNTSESTSTGMPVQNSKLDTGLDKLESTAAGLVAQGAIEETELSDSKFGFTELVEPPAHVGDSMHTVEPSSAGVVARESNLGNIAGHAHTTTVGLVTQSIQLEAGLELPNTSAAEQVPHETELLERNINLDDSLESLNATSDGVVTRHSELEITLETVVEASREATAELAAPGAQHQNKQRDKPRTGSEASNAAVTDMNTRSNELEARKNTVQGTSDELVESEMMPRSVTPDTVLEASDKTTVEVIMEGAKHEAQLSISNSTRTGLLERIAEPMEILQPSQSTSVGRVAPKSKLAANAEGLRASIGELVAQNRQQKAVLESVKTSAKEQVTCSTELVERNIELEDEVRSLKRTCADLVARITKLEDELDVSVNDSQTSSTDIKASLEASNATTSELIARNTELEDGLNALKATSDQLVIENTELKRDLGTIVETSRGTNRELISCTTKLGEALDASNAGITVLVTRNTELETNMKTVLATSAELVDQNTSLRAGLEASDATFARLVMLGVELETKLNTSSAELAERNSQLGDSLKCLEQTMNLLVARNTKLETTLAASVEESQGIIADLLSQNAKLRDDLDASSASIADVVTRNTDMCKRNAELEASLKSLEGTNDGLVSRQTNLETKLENAVDVARRMAIKLFAQNTKLEENLDASNGTMARLTARNTEQEAKLHTLQSTSTELSSRGESLNARLEASEVKTTELAAKYTEMERSIEAVKATSDELVAQNADLEIRMEASTTVSAGLVAQNSRIEESLQASKAEVFAKIPKLDRLESEMRNLKRQIKQAPECDTTVPSGGGQLLVQRTSRTDSAKGFLERPQDGGMDHPVTQSQLMELLAAQKEINLEHSANICQLQGAVGKRETKRKGLTGLGGSMGGRP